MISVYDFLELFVDSDMLKISIVDCTKEDVIFSGNIDDLPEQLGDMMVCSVDNPLEPETLTINVDSDDE